MASDCEDRPTLRHPRAEKFRVSNNARVAPLRPDQLSDEQASLYEAISGGRRAVGPQRFRLRNDDGSLTGPFDLMLRHPAIGRRLSDLGESLRYDGSLPDRAREIAILVVGATRSAEFEWYAHVPIARAVGLSDVELNQIRTGAPEPFDDPVEAAVYRGAHLLSAHSGVDDDQYAVLAASLGTAQMVELVTIVGYYDLLASLLSLFRVGLPDG
jgi:4-carboxymuconolactone decarboxylase